MSLLARIPVPAHLLVRGFNLGCAALCAGMLAYAIYYLEDVLWLEPCPYCKLQRIGFWLLGVSFLAAGLRQQSRLLLLIISAIAMGLSIYASYYLPLTGSHRLEIMVIASAVAIGFGVAGLLSHRLLGARINALMIGISALLGAGVAIRHSYVQLFPDNTTATSCQAATSSIAEVLDFAVIRNILAARGDCGVTDWTFLSLSIPNWGVLAFIGMGVVGVWLNWHRDHVAKQ